MKRIVPVLLSMTLIASLLCPAAQAAQAGQVIGLKEQYTLVGGTSDVKTSTEWVEESYYSSPVVADLDGDGRLEVLNAAYSLTVADAATGTVKWQVNSGRDRSTAFSTDGNIAGQTFTDILVEDIDADGKPEIIIGYRNGSVSVLSNEGYFKPGWPQQVSSASIRSMVAADVDGDGRMEIIVGVGIASPESIWVYRFDGTVQPGWPQISAEQNANNHAIRDGDQISAAYSYGIFANGITVGDLDGDGLPEIIMPTDNPYIVAYNGDGTLVNTCDTFDNRPWGRVALYEDYEVEKDCPNEGWGWGLELQPNKTRADLYRTELGHSAAIYTDVDGDGVSEVVVTALMMDITASFTAASNNWATINDTRYMTVFIFNQDRTRYTNPAKGFDWTTIPTDQNSAVSGPLKTQDAESFAGGVLSEPVAADLDGDGNKEILFNSYNGKLHCFSLDGTEHGSWPYTLPQTGGNIMEFATPPTCVDLDGDGKLEVVFASWTDTYDGSDPEVNRSKVNGAIYVLNSDGELITKYGLHDGIYTYDKVAASNSVYAAPVVQDIDGDGRYEILVNTTQYGLCVYEAIPGQQTQEPPKAYANWLKVIVNDSVELLLPAYALRDANGNDTNYIQVRDLAWYLYNEQRQLNYQGQYNVTWDGEAVDLIPRTPYEEAYQVGGETRPRFVGNQPYTRTASMTKVNGVPANIDCIVLTDANGGGSTYYQLRDLGAALGTFTVDWRGGAVHIDTLP